MEEEHVGVAFTSHTTRTSIAERRWMCRIGPTGGEFPVPELGSASERSSAKLMARMLRCERDTTNFDLCGHRRRYRYGCSASARVRHRARIGVLSRTQHDPDPEGGCGEAFSASQNRFGGTAWSVRTGKPRTLIRRSAFYQGAQNAPTDRLIELSTGEHRSARTRAPQPVPLLLVFG